LQKHFCTGERISATELERENTSRRAREYQPDELKLTFFTLRKKQRRMPPANQTSEIASGKNQGGIHKTYCEILAILILSWVPYDECVQYFLS